MGVWDIHNTYPLRFRPLGGQLALKSIGLGVGSPLSTLGAWHLNHLIIIKEDV